MEWLPIIAESVGLRGSVVVIVAGDVNKCKKET